MIRRHVGATTWRTMRWGFQAPWVTSGPRPINARAETVRRGAMFRRAFAARRCIVPATGFYEWEQRGSVKVPHYLHPARSPLFALAGIWEATQDPRAGEVVTFAVITTTPNRVVASVHDRMPVILEPASWRTWLDDATDLDTLKRLLAPCADDEVADRIVSTRVNSPRSDDPTLVEPAAPPVPPRPVHGSLF